MDTDGQPSGAYDLLVMAVATQHLFRTLRAVARDLASLASSAMRSRARLAAENLFLRKQLALYQERRLKPPRGDDATRLMLAGWSRFLAWRDLLVIVKSETLIRWHRAGISAVLAVEIPYARPARDFSRRAAADRADGTHCQRAFGDA